MKRKLLVVVDMVNGFVKEGALADPKINLITPNIVAKIQNAIINKNMIVGFRDCHQVNDEEFKTFPVHCLDGSKESEYIDEIKKYRNFIIDIPKNTTNGFNTEKFKLMIEKYQFEQIEVVGCCTDICVSDFTTSLISYLKENGRGTKVVIDEKSVATFDLPNHNAKVVGSLALAELEKIGVNVKKKEREQGM